MPHPHSIVDEWILAASLAGRRCTSDIFCGSVGKKDEKIVVRANLQANQYFARLFLGGQLDIFADACQHHTLAIPC